MAITENRILENKVGVEVQEWIDSMAEELIRTREMEKELMEEQLKKQKEELEAKLAELEAAKAASAAPAPGPQQIPLDWEDKLRLENLILREKIAERERIDTRDAFHAKLVAKYKVNLALHSVQVDPATMMMNLIPKNE